ncbi:spore coat protein [Alicyclobacillus sp.]|uniref:spore coat protein n=1 Tax=Alicyclobacillus sp. TaxID=61169 RepID=UPI0025B83472|nr:spore coat protein [Alicyclobacillus sp.]MCL6517521.1 spore coat protein [Alicyclobacillus sp.]
MAPQQAQPQMTTPPRVITTKDASYLKDQMSWLLVAAKKCAHYAKECTDPQVRQAIDRIGQMHQRHYQLLLGHLKTNNSQAMQSVPQPGQTAH